MVSFRDRMPSIGTLVGICFMLLWPWGAVWSFYRHDKFDGFLSITIPPYGMYRGLAAVWEGPEWREKWNERTELIAALISKAADSANDLSEPRYKAIAREWIRSLPEAQKFTLRTASLAYCNVLDRYSVNMLIDTVEGRPLRGALDEEIQEDVMTFTSVSGFETFWKRIVAEEDNMKVAIENAVADVPSWKRDSLLEKTSPLMLNFDARRKRLRIAVDELFD